MFSVLFVLAYFELLGDFQNAIKSIVTISIVGSTLTAILANLIYFKKRKVSYENFSNSYEFEAEFKRILQFIQITDKLLIVFDNLDRVNESVMKEIFGSIKTYLEPKNQKNTKVLFLIPCNEDSIKKCYKEDHSFLEKIFNVSLTMPSLHANDLDSFTKKILEDTEIEPAGAGVSHNIKV